MESSLKPRKAKQNLSLQFKKKKKTFPWILPTFLLRKVRILRRKSETWAALNVSKSLLKPCNKSSKNAVNFPSLQNQIPHSLRTPMNLIEDGYFDLLPDHLVLLIFNKLSDAKSLTICLSVSRRFASLVSQTDSVFLSIPRRKPTSKSKPINVLKILGNSWIAKPLYFIHRIIVPRPPAETYADTIPYYSSNEVLRHFKEVKSMHIELPSQSGEPGLEGGDSLLKWKAEFGSELKSCVILAAKSFQRCNLLSDKSSKENSDRQNEEVLTEDELKLRVVWSISCLIAASARHCLLKQAIADHPTVEDVIISDVNKQGKLCAGRDQIVEMRNMKSSTSSSERTRVPDLSMKLWYNAMLELPKTGFLMKGATLLVIRPADGLVGKKYDDDLFGFDGNGGEKEAFHEAVRALVRMKKSYVMTMNSF